MKKYKKDTESISDIDMFGGESSESDFESSSGSESASGSGSVSVLETEVTEEDFDSFITEPNRNLNLNEANANASVIRSAINRSQFPGFGHDTLHFPRDGETGKSIVILICMRSICAV